MKLWILSALLVMALLGTLAGLFAQLKLLPMEDRVHKLQTALFECEEREISLTAACRIPDAAMEQEIERLEELLAVTDQCCQLCAKELLP